MTDKYKKNPEYDYHFSRDEFEKSRFSEPRTYKGGPFRHNRTLLITLLDISIIVLIIIVVIPFVRKSYEVPDLNGYQLSLTHYRSNEDIFLNLLITNKAKEETDGAGLADIEFFMENSTESIHINDLLPLPGETLTYRTSFLNDGSETASVRVSINGDSTVLNVNLEKK